MRQFLLKPAIEKYENCARFCEEFSVGKGDVILTNEYIYEPYFKSFGLEADVIFQEKYGSGEPSDDMFEAIYNDMPKECGRIIAVGGGTILDIAKLLALKNPLPAEDLLERLPTLQKDKQLVLVPTTCGTGSEVTNISVLALKRKGTKIGLTNDVLCADNAVLIPELLKTLPYSFFAGSSIDALVHAFESCLTPRTTPFSELFAHRAIEMILAGYQKIEKDGPDARFELLDDFLIASNYAGIAFGNGGVGAVHAMSYPLGSSYHVPHGESNYEVFVEIFKTYTALSPGGRLGAFNAMLARVLGCAEAEVYSRLEQLLGAVMPRKPLREYGVTMQDLDAFTEDVLQKQGRLHPNFYVMFTPEQIREIYEKLY